MILAQVSVPLAQALFAANDDGGAGGGIMGLCCAVLPFVLVIVLIAFYIFFLLTMSKALQACSPDNRAMEPGQVWFVFIPVVGIYFFFLMLFKVPESLKNEYDSRRLKGDDDFGKTMALWFLISYFVCFPVGLVLGIMFTLKIKNYTKELTESGGSRGSKRGRARDDDDDGEEEERPSRRPKNDDADEDDRPRRRRPRDEDDE